MMFKINSIILQAFENQSLENKKKATALWGILKIISLMGIIIFGAEVVFQQPWPAQAPVLGILLGFCLATFFLKKGQLLVAQGLFLGFFLLVITAIPFLDPYNHPFELYRYSFLTAMVLALTGSFLNRSRQIWFFTLAICLGILGVFYFRFFLAGVSLDSVLLQTLVVCLVVILLIGVLAVFTLSIQRQLLSAAEEKEAQALIQRDSFARFVPKEFLGLIHKDNIQNVGLGDGVQKAGTILVADIRDFTGISESLTPREIMAFLNDWLEMAAPVIAKHQGIIDKFMGDGLLVLFPHAVEDAIGAALELVAVLGPFNDQRIGHSQRPMKIGIGIHFGDLVLGTIGSTQRMAGTVVSGATHIAAQLEAQTKFYQTPLIISREALYETLNPNQYNYRFLDRVKVKNRETAVEIFELLDALPPHLKELAIQTKDQFEEGLEHFIQGRTTQAEESFQNLVELNPEDCPARIYLDRCKTVLKNQ